MLPSVTLIQPDAPLALPAIAIVSVMYVHISRGPSVSETDRGPRGCPPWWRRCPRVPAKIIPPHSLAALTNPRQMPAEPPADAGAASMRWHERLVIMSYDAADDRYDDKIPYRRVGRSGLHLPAVSLGLWQNFGDESPLAVQRAILRRAFDLGVTHFDLANNYGPPYGSAEVNF